MDRVLVVDDENGIRALMARWVESAGFTAAQAENADRALQEFEDRGAAIALCDIRMPGHDGLWLTEQIRRRYPDTAVIMTTGVQDLDAAVTSLRNGVVDYLVKPFGRERLRDALDRGIHWHRASVDARRTRETLDHELQLRGNQLLQAMGSVEIKSAAALDGALAMLTVRDRTAYEHAKRVARLSVNVAMVLGIGEPDLTILEQGALLHDIGRIAIPDSVLNHPGALTDEERDVLRKHPTLGHQVVARVPFLVGAASIVAAAHERYDGSGYPQGLKGEEIPQGSRIVAVADAFDAMTSPRPYRATMTRAQAIQELMRCRGTQFDPRAVDALLQVLAVQ
ncbi:MAG: response regulator [Acidobacteria bacterium]|nr:response regulator [Acidobacteriota bacterium]